MEIVVKQFFELSAKELFEAYKLRSEVFVVEQNCAYQDVDEKDLEAYHVYVWENTFLIGYARILPIHSQSTELKIGRVVVSKQARKKQYGKVLMNYCINKCLELFKNQDIVISAQSYLITFYNQLGFNSEGNEYLEDGIPHTKMRLKVA